MEYIRHIVHTIGTLCPVRWVQIVLYLVAYAVLYVTGVMLFAVTVGVILRSTRRRPHPRTRWEAMTDGKADPDVPRRR